MNSAEIIKRIKADGWYLVHTVGSHHQFKHPTKKDSTMFYPIYVYAEEGCAYSATFPDIPGCFTAADEIEDLQKAAQEAIEAHFGADADPIPAASTPDAWLNHEDYQDGGFWMMVDIDLNKVRSRAVRLNISLPEGLVHRIDAAAQKRGQSRSAFLASAAEHEMASA